MGKLKRFAIVLAIGAALGIAGAEVWRRTVLHDSYVNYLPPPLESEDGNGTAGADGAPATGHVRRAANRLWSPVSASARLDLSRVRRIRAHAPRPASVPEPVPVETEADTPTS
jgi:hypothetical protein